MSIHTADKHKKLSLGFSFIIYWFSSQSKFISLSAFIQMHASRGVLLGKVLATNSTGFTVTILERKRTRKNNNNNKNYETNRTGEIPNKTTLNLQQQLMVVFHPQLQGELHQLQEISQVHETQEVCKHGFKYLRTSRNLSPKGKGGYEDFEGERSGGSVVINKV